MDGKLINYKEVCEVRLWHVGISILCEECKERGSCLLSARDSNRQALEPGKMRISFETLISIVEAYDGPEEALNV